MIMISLFFFDLSLGSEFIRIEGSQLMLGDEKFTFSGVNIYWLGQVIDDKEKLSKYQILRMKTTQTHPQESSPFIPILKSTG